LKTEKALSKPTTAPAPSSTAPVMKVLSESDFSTRHEFLIA